MVIHEENIELILFEYLEGELSQEEQERLLDYLNAHPEHNTALEQWKQVYGHKEEEKDYKLTAKLLIDTTPAKASFWKRTWVIAGLMLTGTLAYLVIMNSETTTEHSQTKTEHSAPASQEKSHTKETNTGSLTKEETLLEEAIESQNSQQLSSSRPKEDTFLKPTTPVSENATKPSNTKITQSNPLQNKEQTEQKKGESSQLITESMSQNKPSETNKLNVLVNEVSAVNKNQPIIRDTLILSAEENVVVKNADDTATSENTTSINTQEETETKPTEDEQETKQKEKHPKRQKNFDQFDVKPDKDFVPVNSNF